MKKVFTLLLWLGIILPGACAPLEPGPALPAKSGEVPVAHSLNKTPPAQTPQSTAPAPVLSTLQPTVTPQIPETPPAPSTAHASDVPQILEQLNFGLPGGNGHRPRRMAMAEQYLYLFNEGSPAVDNGNTISVFNINTGQFTDLLQLNNRQPNANIPPAPLSLTADPYRPRLYAIWGDPFGEISDTSLSIIDTESLSIVNTLSGVEAILPAPNRLYLVNDERLWTLDPDTLSKTASQNLPPAQYNAPMRLHLEAKRLYLGRGRPWRVEIFAADSLSPVESYPLKGDLAEILVDVEDARLLIFERLNGQIMRRALDFDGVSELDAAAKILPVDVYGDLPVVGLGQFFYTFDFPYPDRLLRGFNRADFSPQNSIPLPCSPADLLADPQKGLLYAVCGSPASVLLKIDPAAPTIKTHYTALSIVDALSDPDQERLYLLDNAGELRVLNLGDYSEAARAQSKYSALASGQMTGSDELALDAGRDRLYVSGNPVHIINTKTLQVSAVLSASGQLTPDPATDRLYLTPPCRCRQEVCNTLILNADTLTGTQTILPPNDDPFVSPCVISTRLDAPNQLLYARLDNGVPGSNSGYFYTVFNVADAPQKIYTVSRISYDNIAIDSPNKRAFAPRYRINRTYIHRLEVEKPMSQTLELVSAGGELAFDAAANRLYAVRQLQTGPDIQVFDGDLALLADIPIPKNFHLLDYDPANRRLYLGDANGALLIVAAGGGKLPPAPPYQPGSESPATPQLVVAPDGVFFRLFDGRLFRSADNGNTWKVLGRGLPALTAGALGVSPDYLRDKTLLVGLWGYGWTGGLYRSRDGGNTWQPATRGLTDLEVERIVYSPTYTRDRTIFATTFDRGLFRSTDGGNSWQSLAAAYSPDDARAKVDTVAVSPAFANDGLVFISHNTLLRSDDGGNTWTDTGLPGGFVAFSPNFARDNLILLDGLWRSNDAGLTWQPAAAGRETASVGVNGILFSPDFDADSTVYLTFRKDYQTPLSIQRSTDAGIHWQSLPNGLPADFVAASILPDGDLLLMTEDGQTQHISPDALTWGSPPIDITQLDLQALAISPDNALFVANGGAGVLRSLDGGQSWQDTGFPARDGGAFRSARLAMSGETLFAAVGSALLRSNDGGATWLNIGGNLPAGFVISALATSGGEDGVLLIGGNYAQNALLRSADGGQSWQSVFNGANIAGAAEISVIAFSPDFVADQRVYAWLQYGGLLRSTDGGLSWQLAMNNEQLAITPQPSNSQTARPPDRQTTRLPDYFVQSMAVSPVDGSVWLGALDGHVLRVPPDGGAWQDVKDNIPDDRDWSSVLRFAADGVLWLGTDKGVYFTADNGAIWTRASNGLPRNPDDPLASVAVRDLQFSGSGSLYAAMSRGGVFVTDNRGRNWRAINNDE